MRLHVNVLLLAAVLLGPCTGAFAATLFGQVVSVADGDTLTVLDSSTRQHKVRLAGIDAPEKRQPFGERSRQNLSKMVAGHNAVIEWTKFDRYGRVLGKVLVDGQDANLAQVAEGFAWHYKRYAREQPMVDRKIYSDAENTARTSGLGLWAEPAPIPPWDFRHKSR